MAWFSKKKPKKPSPVSKAGGSSASTSSSDGIKVQPRPTVSVPPPNVEAENVALGGNVIVPRKEFRRPGRPKSEFSPDMELLYVRHYVKLLNKMGNAHFQAYFPNSFLVGIGLLADLASDSRAGARMTRAVELDSVDVAADGTPGSAGRVWELKASPIHGTPGVVRIGRAQSNDVVVPEFAISQHHCQVERVERRFMVSDVESLNGTYVNGTQLEKGAVMEIQNLDVLILGRFQFQFFNSSGFLEEVAERAAMQL